MTQETKNEMIRLTQELIAAQTCSDEARQAARRWLDALDTPAQSAQTQAYIAELEEDLMPIEQLIAFARSEKGAAYFGAQKAAEIAAHAEQIKANGAAYCDCPACAAAEAILKKLR